MESCGPGGQPRWTLQGGLRARLKWGQAEPTESGKVLLEELLGGRGSTLWGRGCTRAHDVYFLLSVIICPLVWTQG